jgi:cytochrome c553
MRHGLTAAAAVAAALGISGPGFAQTSLDTDRIERVVHVCNACHGENGNSKDPAFPKLAGQTAAYTRAQLQDFRSQKRADSSPQAYMWGISALLDDATIEGLAEYYSVQTPVPGKPGPAALAEKGQRVFAEGVPARDIQACAACHGDKGQGKGGAPRIAGQHAEYIVRQLNELRTKLRSHSMTEALRTVKALTAEDMQAVAAYLQGK